MTATSAAEPAEGENKGHLFGFELPDFSVRKDHDVQTLIYAKNVQKLGIATLSYGAAIYMAESGASQLAGSLVAVSGYIRYSCGTVGEEPPGFGEVVEQLWKGPGVESGRAQETVTGDANGQTLDSRQSASKTID